MGLSQSQIDALLKAEMTKPKRGPSKGGGRTSSGKNIDVSIRDYQTWFKLSHSIFENGEPDEHGRAKCSNPNCEDTRDIKAIVLAEVNGVKMCRHCFLGGYMSKPSEDQLSLES